MGLSKEKCGCGGTYEDQGETFDSYINCMTEVFKCNRCKYIWHKIKED